MATTPTKRQRRSTEEVRKRLLDAARELFLAHGYEQTYTQDTTRAGVIPVTAQELISGRVSSPP